jgi:carbon starvation protein CstA
MDFYEFWRYFGLFNESLATVVLWIVAIYLARENKFHWVASRPATFMTRIVFISVIYFQPTFKLSLEHAISIGAFSAFAILILFIISLRPTKLDDKDKIDRVRA